MTISLLILLKCEFPNSVILSWSFRQKSIAQCSMLIQNDSCYLIFVSTPFKAKSNASRSSWFTTLIYITSIRIGEADTCPDPLSTERDQLCGAARKPGSALYLKCQWWQLGKSWQGWLMCKLKPFGKCQFFVFFFRAQKMDLLFLPYKSYKTFLMVKPDL